VCDVKNEKETSLFSAFLKVFFISALFWGAFFSAWAWQKVQQRTREQDERLLLHRIAARSKSVDKAPLSLLSSLLEIKDGMPLFSLQPAELVAKIHTCPAFSNARVWRLLPGTLGVEYTLRTPIAHLSGFRNVVLDKTGTLFFLLPYFAPKKLPTVVFDFPQSSTLEELQKEAALSKDLTLALRMVPVLTAFASKYKLILESIDLSKRNHLNIFRREIVLTFSPELSKGGEYLYVRCNARSLSLKKLQKVIAYICSSEFHSGIVDMRFPSVVLCSMEGRK
jgi:hypothetical protein